MTTKFASATFNIKHAAYAFSQSLAAYLFIVAFASLIVNNVINESASLSLIHFGGFLAIFLSYKNFRWGGHSALNSYGGLLLTIGMLFSAHAAIDTLAFGLRYEEISKYRYLPFPDNPFFLYLKGEFIAVFGLLLVAFAWRLKIGKNLRVSAISTSKLLISPKLLYLLYTLSLAIGFLDDPNSSIFGPLQQFSQLVYITGITAIYFLSLSRLSGIFQVLTAIVLGLPLSLAALNSGMKGEIILPMLPFIYFFWTCFRNYIVRIFFIVALVYLLVSSQLYVHSFRSQSWFGHDQLKISPVDSLILFIGQLNSPVTLDAFDSISSRLNMTAYQSITVLIADNYGQQPIKIFGDIPASFIPRIFWPNKPILRPGADQTARILNYSGPSSDMTSSTASQFSAEFYLGGGWIGFIFGSISYGWLLANVNILISRFCLGFPCQLFCLATLLSALRFEELHVSYAFTDLILLLLYAFFLRYFIELFHIRYPKR